MRAYLEIFLRRSAAATPLLLLLAGCSSDGNARPGNDAAPPVTAVAHVHSVEDALATFDLPPGYRAEIVAYEPMIEDPVAIDFDPDGRMYVVEMRGYMPGLSGEGEDVPNGRIVVLEDTDGDGLMDQRTVFLDSLVLPRSVKVLEAGVLVAATPNLWLAHDFDGDLVADSLELLRDDYGTTQSNPEHNANGLLWGIDNWIHNANYAGQFRLHPDGTFKFRETPSQGQWGVSMDEYGRLYRNSNEDPLRAELIPAHYARRNPNQGSIRGVYERLTPNVEVWPGRSTPAVNRGYQSRTLRPDSTLAHYTSAGSPVAYVGDRLPDELRNTVFVTEPAGNLIGRFVVEEGADGLPTARRAREDRDFMTSTDQRFRPVNVATAPDGTLYVVDMYRGIIQHRTYITGYLEDQIRAREMEQPIGLGRIYRIVHESYEPGERPALSQAAPEELVRTLAHPNGWWRITAQRLLVERQARSAVPALREMALRHDDERARLHALWTLDGLGAADRSTLLAAAEDSSPHLRAAAVRIAEPLVGRGDEDLTRVILGLLGDQSVLVRRQVAASVGELPVNLRDDALQQVAIIAGDDPIVADLVVSGLRDRELPFLELLLASDQDERSAATIQALASTVMRGRDAGSVEHLLALAVDDERAAWQRVALLEGLRPPGGRGFGGRGAASIVELRREPQQLLRLTSSQDSVVARLAGEVSQALGWPGKPQPQVPEGRELTAEEAERLAAGEQLFQAHCAVCHQADGEGLEGVARSLVGSRWALGGAGQAARIVLHGKEGEMLMPGLGSTLSDEEIAATLTYVRRSWGNNADPVAPAQVAEARGEAGSRRQAWTEEELLRFRW